MNRSGYEDLVLALLKAILVALERVTAVPKPADAPVGSQD